MTIKIIWIISLIINIPYALLCAYIFLATAFFSGQSFLGIIAELGLSYLLPIMISIVAFILFQYQISIDIKSGLTIYSKETNIYFVINLIFILISSYRLLKLSGAF